MAIVATVSAVVCAIAAIFNAYLVGRFWDVDATGDDVPFWLLLMSSVVSVLVFTFSASTAVFHGFSWLVNSAGARSNYTGALGLTMLVICFTVACVSYKRHKSGV